MTSVIKFTRLNRHPGDRAIKLLEEATDSRGVTWTPGAIFHGIISHGVANGRQGRPMYATVRTTDGSGTTTFYGPERE